MTARLRVVWVLALVAGLFVAVQSLAVGPAYADSQAACEARGGTWVSQPGPSGTIEFVCQGGSSGDPGDPDPGGPEPEPEEGETRTNVKHEECTPFNPDPSVENPGCGGGDGVLNCQPPTVNTNIYTRPEVYHRAQGGWVVDMPAATAAGGTEAGDYWVYDRTGCEEPAEDVPTAAEVWAAVKRLSFPGAKAQIQPANGRTLVKFKTNFYVDPDSTKPVDLPSVDVGQATVHVVATPVEYRWNFDDGSPVEPTKSPGAEYPDLKVVHEYTKADNVTPSVTIMYRIEWEFNGSGLQAFDELIPAADSPPTPLEVVESTARLGN